MRSRRALTLMMTCLWCVAAAPAGAQQGVGGTPRDLSAYVGGAGEQRLHTAAVLSDGTVLVGGGATRLDWLPANVRTTELQADAGTGQPGESTPFLLHLSADLQTVLAAVTLPPTIASDIRRIRTTAAPGEPTGDLFISGVRNGQGREEGYFIARLDANFVTARPTRLVWTHDVWATGHIKNDQPWDVGGDGKVIFALGTPHGYDWVAVERLSADGESDVVPHWRMHRYHDADGKAHEHHGEAASAPHPVYMSNIVLKVWDRGDFRSWTREDYQLETSDGNGGKKIGRWPLDAMFDGPFDPATRKTDKVRDNGRGYFGYRWGNTPCASIGAIVIDRRTNAMYIGGNNKSRLPDGNPDFEPWVVAMNAEGQLQWWQRLYSEEKGVSTPDQYIDAMAIDYRPRDAGGHALVVVARNHGNNVNNFWQGDQIRHPDNPGTSFQKQFTGTHGNIHMNWIGRLTLDEGTMLHATYLGEYAEGTKHGSGAFADPLLSHWPAFTSGWPDLNTTRVKPGSLHVDERGRIYLTATGRRVITTSNAFMQMPSPLRDAGAKGQWADFVRVYAPDLTTLRYSSILTGQWDWTSGLGGSKHELASCVPVPGGVLVIGTSDVDKNSGQAVGDDMPTRGVPAWAVVTRQGRMGVVAKLHFDGP